MATNYLLTFLSSGQEGVQYANTICVHDSDVTVGRGVSQTVDNVDSWLRAPYLACLPSTVSLVALRCFHIPATYGDDSDITTKLIGVAGGLVSSDGKVPREATLTLSLRSNHTSRRAQGRLAMPSPLNSAAMATDGTWLTSSTYWTKIGLFGDALLAGHDLGIGGIDGHLSTRVYSRADHKEGDSDPTYDIASYLRRPRPRWMRRRVSIP